MVHGAFCGGWVYEDFKIAVRGGRLSGPDPRPHRPSAGRQPAGGRGPIDDRLRRRGRQAVRPAAGAAGPDRTFPRGPDRPACRGQGEPRRAHPAGAVGALGRQGSSLNETMSAFSLYALGPYWAMAVDPDYPAARRYLFSRLARADRRTTFARMTAGERPRAVGDPELVARPVHHHPGHPGLRARSGAGHRRRSRSDPSARHGRGDQPPTGRQDRHHRRPGSLADGGTWMGAGGGDLPRLDRGAQDPRRRLNQARTRPNRATSAHAASMRKAERLNVRSRDRMTRQEPARFISSDGTLTGSSLPSCAAA